MKKKQPVDFCGENAHREVPRWAAGEREERRRGERRGSVVNSRRLAKSCSRDGACGAQMTTMPSGFRKPVASDTTDWTIIRGLTRTST
jgi:hypothetical protein